MENTEHNAWSILELILLIMTANLITTGLEFMAKGFGVEISHTTTPIWLDLINWGVIYSGIVIMLYASIFPRRDSPIALIAIVIVEFIEGSNLLFMKILPEIEWARTGDVLTFLGGLALLSLLVLIIAFYPKIHQILTMEEDNSETETDTEDEEKEKEDEEKENN